MMTQEVQFWDTKVALGDIDDNTIVFQMFKNGLQLSEMLLRRWVCDEHIIYVCVHEVKALQYLVYDMLESVSWITGILWSSKISKCGVMAVLETQLGFGDMPWVNQCVRRLLFLFRQQKNPAGQAQGSSLEQWLCWGYGNPHMVASLLECA